MSETNKAKTQETKVATKPKKEPQKKETSKITMTDSDLQIIFKINSLCKKIINDFKNVDRYEFFKPDSLDRDAFSFRLLQLGELANSKNITLAKEGKREEVKHLSSTFLEKNEGAKAFTWNQAYSLRCRLAHNIEVQSKKIWRTCHVQIPNLLKYTNKILETVKNQEKEQVAEKQKIDKEKPVKQEQQPRQPPQKQSIPPEQSKPQRKETPDEQFAKDGCEAKRTAK